MSEERGTTTVPTTDEPEDDPADDPRPAADPRPATFRVVPTVSLVAVAFLALCLSPIAFQGGAWFLLFAIPAAAAVWVVWTRTRVDNAGLRVRGLLGTRSMAWADVATLRLAERGWVHAVPHEGAELTLRGVRIRDLGRVGDASGGRISVPSPAEAEAAAEHARELEAARMRIARLRDRQESATDRESGEDAATHAEADPVRADGGGVGGRRADTDTPDAMGTPGTTGPTGTTGTPESGTPDAEGNARDARDTDDTRSSGDTHRT